MNMQIVEVYIACAYDFFFYNFLIKSEFFLSVFCPLVVNVRKYNYWVEVQNITAPHGFV